MSVQRYDFTQSHAGKLLNIQSELDFVYTPAEADAQEPLHARLLYVSHIKYEEDWHSTVHSHDFSELFLILGGSGQFFVSGCRHEVSAGDLIIINPQVEHTELPLRSGPLEYIVLGIDGLQFSDKNSAAYSFSPVRISYRGEKLRQYFELLLWEVQRTQPGYDAVCQNLLNIIMLLLLRHEKVDISVPVFPNVKSDCASVKSFIDSHFREQISLETLAEAVHQSKFYMAHTFKDTFGISPIRYLTERRVEECMHLLSTTDYSIGEISSIAGFSSLSVFSQTFKRITHLSPNEFRKRTAAQKKKE